MLVKLNAETGAVEPWRGEPLQTTTSLATLVREDGTQEQVEVEPYAVTRKLPINVEIMWTKEELLAYGLLRVVPAVAPEGKQFVGDVRYRRDGDVAREVRDLEDAPPPPDTVTIAVEEHDRLVADAEKWRLRDVAAPVENAPPATPAEEKT